MSGANNVGRRKPLDTRIPALISNSLLTGHRSFFVMVGDQSKMHAQIVNLHFLLSQAIAGLANPTDGEFCALHCWRGVASGFSSRRSCPCDVSLIASPPLHSPEEEPATKRPLGVP